MCRHQRKVKLGNNVIRKEELARRWRNRVHKQAQQANSKSDVNPTNNSTVAENNISSGQEEKANPTDDGRGGRD